MKRLRDQGLTLDAIGKRFRVTRQRVAAILGAISD
jgi:DNA-directed RNA polymerase sigma subunit (sigma70/sigma32)